MTEKPYARLLSPLEVGDVVIKNRLTLTAHGDHLADQGKVTEGLIRHYERRAEGGVGLVVAGGSAPVHPDASHPGLMNLWDPANEPMLKEMTDRVHAHGATLLCQATHRSFREAPRGDDPRLVAPSSMPGPPPLGSSAPLTLDEIDDIVRHYAEAAARLERCGFDGIEVTALGSHLIELFWSPVTNRRTDHYGGSLQNRLRFGIDVLRAVQEATGPRFLIAFRMSGDLMTNSLGLTPDDLTEIADQMCRATRIDLLDISGGSGASTVTHSACVPPESFPAGCFTHLGSAMKRRVQVPVLVAGRILDAEHAERTLRAGDADLVGMTRALIADPDLPRWLEAQDTSRVRPCIAINEGCRRGNTGKQLACTVNPDVGRTGSGWSRALKSRQIVVVGAGPAGMETARVAAERGHAVTVFEQATELGGQVRIAGKDPSRPHLTGHIAWLERELARLGVPVDLGTGVEVEDLGDMRADKVVLATGARSVVPAVAGGLGCPAVTDVEVLAGEVELAGRVLVYDAEGHHRGGAIAAHIAELGASVDLVTSYGRAAEHLEPTNKPPLYRRLAAAAVTVVPDRRLAGTRAGHLLTQDVWLEEEHVHEGYDLVIFTGFREPNTALFDVLAANEAAPDVVRVGDARAPRLLRNAVSEGERLGAAL